MKDYFKNIRVIEPQLSDGDKADLWRKIEQETIRRKKVIYMRMVKAVSSVAAVILLYLGYLHVDQQDVHVVPDYQEILTESFDPAQVKNVQVILSQEQQIVIESSNAELAYDQSGDITINSRRVEDKNSRGMNKLIVPYGKTSTLRLSDNTRIWVNSGSKLVYPSVFKDDNREIFVEGEIYLEVNHDPGRPFTVKTRTMQIQVYGTSFNVSAYKEDTIQSVVLVSGSVGVSGTGMKDAYQMSVNQKFTYDISKHYAEVEAVDVNDYICWRLGYLKSRNEPLDMVLTKLGRHYNVPMKYDREVMKRITVSGKLDFKGNIEDVLSHISITAPVTYRMDGDTLVIN